MPKLWLGTVQFGLDYGVSNAGGRVSDKEAGVILDHAHAAGVDTLDTAPGYGKSEEVLGELGAAERFRIVTKTPQFRVPRLTEKEGDAVQRSLDASLARLKTTRVKGLLVHLTDDLLGPGGDHLYEAMSAAKADGRVERIGVSVYDPPEAEAVLVRYAVDFMQIPLNVLDQRFLKSGVLAKCTARGIAVHNRSALLQGLLVMEPGQVPARLKAAQRPVAAFHAAARAAGAIPIQACLDFVFGIPQLEGVLCGVASVRDFDELAAIAARAHKSTMDFARLAVDDPAVIDPRCWPAAGAA